MLVGNVVTILVDHPDGSTENVKGLVGVVTAFYEGSDDYEPSWRINTDMYEGGYLYGKTQFRKATENEMADTLRSFLM